MRLRPTLSFKELGVQSAYDWVSKNSKGGRLNYMEKERGEEREKYVEGVVRRNYKIVYFFY